MTTEHATQYWWPSAARVVRAEAEPGRLIDWSRHEQLFNVDVVVAFMQSQRELRRLERSLEGTRAILLTHPFIDPRHASPRTTIWEGSVAILPRRHMRLQLLLKRAIDWIFAFGLILVLAPVLVAIGLAIRLDSRGPVLFRQARVGRAGAPFYMLKFRTMIVGADLVRNLATDERGKDSQFRIRADPRITRVGAFLRRLSLDELPNIFNVLAGSMSLVGPRPALPLEAEMYDEESARRLSVKPGITGLWQVSGRSDLSWEKSVQLDLWYVDNWSLLLDARILLRTVRVVFAGHGAY